jgi:tetratricopeptide (TPR) repeat protein
VRVLSAIDAYQDHNTLSRLLDLSLETTDSVIDKLHLNNLIQRYTAGQSIEFSSDALKKYVYASIQNKQELHINLARIISEKLPAFNNPEEARQYELGGDYEMCFKILNQELEESEKHSAFAYMKNILEHLIKLPLSASAINKVKVKLIDIYSKLSEFKTALRLAEEIQYELLNAEEVYNVDTIKANSLIGAGEYELAKRTINNLLVSSKDYKEKQRLSVELAFAEFELKNYLQAEENCNLVLNDSELSFELKGRCYNLKGMLSIYRDNDLKLALKNFQTALKYFNEGNLLRYVAAMENNIGNIYNILGDYNNAEKHWKLASEINQAIGNLDWDGVILQNIGLFYFSRQKPDLAIESYQKSYKIFISLGNELNRGLILINLGEVYLRVCEYEKSLNSLNEAVKLFEKMKNEEEVAESIFQLGKLYFSVGYTLKLEEKIKQLEEKLNKIDLPKKYLANQKYLRLLLLILKEDKVNTDDIINLQLEYKNLDERNLVTETKLMLIDSLIKQEKYNNALTHLSDSELIDLCSQNSILEAEREYFLGIISGNYATDRLLPPLVHFEKAYEIINGEHITELIWKVLFSISELYIQRGNLNRAKRYVIYARELIYFIAEKIESPRLRAAYLGHSERINTLRKLESFYPSK